MLMWHDENCKKIFEVASNYAQGAITKEDAKSELDGCNLRVFYTFKENIRTILEEILAEEKVVETPQQQTVATTKKNRNQSRRKK